MKRGEDSGKRELVEYERKKKETVTPEPGRSPDNGKDKGYGCYKEGYYQSVERGNSGSREVRL